MGVAQVVRTAEAEAKRRAYACVSSRSRLPSPAARTRWEGPGGGRGGGRGPQGGGRGGWACPSGRWAGLIVQLQGPVNTRHHPAPQQKLGLTVLKSYEPSFQNWEFYGKSAAAQGDEVGAAQGSVRQNPVRVRKMVTYRGTDQISKHSQADGGQQSHRRGKGGHRGNGRMKPVVESGNGERAVIS